MAGFEPTMNMYDVRLKPVMLRSLIRHYIPEEKPPLNPNNSNSNSCFELSKVVSILRTHRLLSESHTQSMDQKLIHAWKSAVDDWVERLLLLLSSDMSDKCWVGISLLGVTCQECSKDRFLKSYSDWRDKLLLHIEPPTDSQLVKVASCAALSDLFTRLARFPDVRKDGTSVRAEKLIQPILKLLNDDCAETVVDGAASLFYTILIFFPATIRHHYDRAEAAIASKILSGKYSTKALKKLGNCLALLPKSKGDEDSWCLMMQKILLSINELLNDAFQGVEEEAKSDEVRRLLVPPGKDLPSPLGHTTIKDTSCKATRSSERLPASTISTLIYCCCKMLTSSYPIQVTAPVRAMLALVERLLAVDGSPHIMSPFMTAMQQELICSELPVLHAYSLELLIAIIKGIRSQLLPHAAYVVRLVTKYFARCALPELRMKLYSITRMLLITMGVGMAVYLAPDVIHNAFTDLNSLGDENIEACLANTGPSSGALTQTSNRKRKHGTKTGFLEEKQDRIGSETEEPNMHYTTPIAVKIAALDTLEVLLTVGAASKSESWRSSIDSLLIKTATNCCTGGWGDEENNIFLPHESTSIWADFQFSSLRALLASFLAPSRARPPYLAQGLQLFRRGKQEAGTKLAGFCAYALLALEVLIHPRALPLDDYPSTHRNSSDGAIHGFPENMFSIGQKHNAIFSNSKQGMERSVLESDDDDLYDRWIQNENENIPVDNMKDRTSTPNEVKGQEQLAGNADLHSRNEDEIMAEPRNFQESIPESNETVSAKAVMTPEVARNPDSTEVEFKKTVSASDGLNSTDDVLADKVDVSDNVHRNTSLTANKANVFDNVHQNTSLAISNVEKGNASLGYDSDSSMDSFPKIVDADPDSD